MVCDRCNRVVREELDKIGVGLSHVELGEVETLEDLSDEKIREVKITLERNGFELLDDRKDTLIENIRTLLIEEVQYLKGHKPAQMNFSDYLAQKTGYEYSYISNLFSSETGQTIEQYIIALKVEKIKAASTESARLAKISKTFANQSSIKQMSKNFVPS